MFWMLKYKLFGWHYIEYRDTSTTFVARVYETPNGELRMKGGFCGGCYNANLKEDGTFLGKNGTWIPLTW